MTTPTITRSNDQDASTATYARDPETLIRLSHHEDGRVKFLVAHNPHTPVEVLEAFATDTSPVIRRGVAKNPNTPADLLMALARDEDFIVRKAAALNRATPLASLFTLKTDKDKEVSELANHFHKLRNSRM